MLAPSIAFAGDTSKATSQSSPIVTSDEIHQDVNPSAPKTTYTLEGVKKVTTPAGQDIDNTACNIYERLMQLNQSKDWKKLIELSELQMKERPEWLTPFYSAGYGYFRLGQDDKALERFMVVEKRIGKNPDYKPLQKTLKELLKALRSRRGQ
jgi:hypothetical protein